MLTIKFCSVFSGLPEKDISKYHWEQVPSEYELI